jgi:DNA polymerase IV
MTSQRNAEKEAFFRDLNRLDELSDDEDTDGVLRETVSVSIAPIVASTTGRRRPSESATQLPSLAPSATAPDPITAPKRQSIARPRPPTLQRARSEASAIGRVKKAGAKGKKGKALPAIPPDRQLFRGCAFFFIPDHDSPLVRALRISFAEQHGAMWVREWDDTITHIIVEQSLPFQEFAKAFPDRTLPHDIPVISEEWISDCSIRKAFVDFNQKRFILRGMSTPYELQESVAEKERLRREHSTNNLFSKRKILDTRSKDPDADDCFRAHDASPIPPHNSHVRPGPGTSGQHDELDELISKMQRPDYTALDDLVRSDPSFNFDDDFVLDPDELTFEIEKHKWQCMSKNERGQKDDNPNWLTIKLLEQMAAIYDRQGDQWRCQAFRKAAASLKQQTKFIRTKKEALALPNIGESIAQKIEEIATTGSFQRLENVRSNPFYRVIELFRGIYGVGSAQAKAWAAAGYDSLEQLLESGELTENQKIGVEHYEDFETRIPRDEVTQHGLTVGRALKAADPGLEFVIGGSYRRGNADSGDIDVMIFKKDAELGYLQQVILGEVVPQLKRDGFIVAELATSNDSNSSKWMGASLLPDMKIWRRLDLLFVPWEERGAALLYWTGNDIFNRSLRLYASRKRMRLNQHGLFENTMRGPGRVKITEGKRIAGANEKEIFEILGVPYRPPEHRNP